MPELPDVEVFRQYAVATSLHQKIEKVDVNSPRIIEGISQRRFRSRLENRSLESTARHGKYLFALLDNGDGLMLHFGMTGGLKYFKHEDEDVPYARILINFINGYHLAYVSKRQLGRVGVVEDIGEFVEEKGLGPDALALDIECFEKILGRGRGTVKSTLMNQHLIAGIGNVYSDEMLFQSRIHPRAEVADLEEHLVKELFDNMQMVLKKAIECRVDPEKFPDYFLLPERRKGGRCPSCGRGLERIRVSGRGSYFCPECQAKHA